LCAYVPDDEALPVSTTRQHEPIRDVDRLVAEIAATSEATEETREKVAAYVDAYELNASGSSRDGEKTSRGLVMALHDEAPSSASRGLVMALHDEEEEVDESGAPAVVELHR
jgi:hypothetical protein